MSHQNTTTKLDREVLVLGAVVVLGTITAILDATIVNVAVPTLRRAFDAPVASIQWVMTGYLLAFASAIPLTGWAGGRFGAKRVWLAGLAIFVYGMSEAGASGGFGGARTLAGIATGVALVATFAWHARRRGRAALIDVSLFRSRGFAAAAGTNLLVGIALFGALILLPLYFQLVRGETPLATGLLLVPQGLGAAVALPVAGRLTDEIGARVVIPFGVLLALAGMAVYTQVDTETSYWLLGASLF